MSSIAGCWTKTPQGVAASELVDRMVKSAPHRGVCLHELKCGDAARLGVGSDGDATRQSAVDDIARVSIVIDGSVFSCTDPADLLTKGEDARLLLDRYVRHGLDFLSTVDGTFALALYDGRDEREPRLILGRDRLGVKPLFYAQTENGVVFGSEIKMLLASQALPARVNLHAVDQLLSYSYVPAPFTMFEGIRQLLPGHVAIVSQKGISEQPYWEFKYPAVRRKAPLEDLAHEFLHLFQQAVERRLARFPEACAFLSGGLDSSSVVAMMRRIKGSSFSVFSAGFTEKAYNEIEDARAVADHVDANLLTTVIDYQDDFADLLERIVWHHDAPFADTSAIPSYYAAKLAKEHTNTVLTGDFPDQLIGGSGHQARALSREANDPSALKLLRTLHLDKLVHRLPLRAGGTGILDKAKRFAYREVLPLEKQRIIESMPVPPLLKRCLYSDDLLEETRRRNPLELSDALYRKVQKEDLLNKLLYYDILSYAPDDLMIKVERMTAAHGLNAFSPFHDSELVEFVASLPSDLKIRGNERKFIMRRAMEPFLPDHTMNKRKQGFAMPMGEWLIKNLADYVREILLDSKTLNRGYFDKSFTRRMVESFLAGKSDYASGSESTIICLLTLELWHRAFVDQ